MVQCITLYGNKCIFYKGNEITLVYLVLYDKTLSINKNKEIDPKVVYFVLSMLNNLFNLKLIEK
jgi:hypothetical protein